MAERGVTITLRHVEWVALVALVGVLVAMSGVFADEAGAERRQVSCFSAEDVEAVRADPSAFVAVAEGCRSEMAEAIPGDWPVEAVDAVTASLVSHRMAPYGSTDAVTAEEIRHSDRQHCGTYALMAMDLLAEMPHEGTSQMWLIGYAGGKVGHHGQLMWHGNGERQLLIDPSVGVFAPIGFDDLMSGHEARQVVDMGVWRDDAHLDRFRDLVISALRDGAYRPSDLLYRYEDSDGLERWWAEAGKLDPSVPTPALMDWRQAQEWGYPS